MEGRVGRGRDGKWEVGRREEGSGKREEGNGGKARTGRVQQDGGGGHVLRRERRERVGISIGVSIVVGVVVEDDLAETGPVISNFSIFSL